MKSDLNLRHLAHLIAVCDNNFSVSQTAANFNVAQPVISRNIHTLEEYFGAPLFVRHGRRLVGMTTLCAALCDSFRELTMRAESIKEIADDILKQPVAGEFSIACTHLQARYILPIVLTKVRSHYPEVKVNLHQSYPKNINDMIMSNTVNLGICSEHLRDEQSFKCIEAFEWQRILIVPKHHPILRKKKITLEHIAAEPTITYMSGITGRRQFDQAFTTANLCPNVVIAAADSDVIKELTRKGHGVGIISSIAYEPKLDHDLQVRTLPGLFKTMSSRVVHRRDRVLSDAQRLFIDIFCTESAKIAKRCHQLSA